MRRIAAVLLLLLGSACRNQTDQARSAGSDSLAVDTMNRDPDDGLSRSQIQRSARPMTPEQAAQMGIIDTTIKLEDQSSRSPVPDSTR